MRSFCAPVALSVLATLVFYETSRAAVLFNNGPVVTGTSGGNPISTYDGSTAGLSIRTTAALADDFTVPAGGWQLSSFTFYAYVSNVTSNPVNTAEINLYSSAPGPGVSAINSSPLDLATTQSSLVAYRVSSSSPTTTSRPIYSYTVNFAANALPNSDKLSAGTYWISFSASNSANSNVPLSPLVTPISSAPNKNLMMFDGTSWGTAFDGSNTTAAPFILNGTVLPEPVGLGAMSLFAALGLRRRR